MPAPVLPAVLAGLGFGPWTFFQWRTPGWPDSLEAEPSQLGALQAAKTDTHPRACGRRAPASSSSSSGRASRRGCRSPTTTVARRLRSALSFCSASFMASISEEGKQGVSGEQKAEEPSRLSPGLGCSLPAPHFWLAGNRGQAGSELFLP